MREADVNRKSLIQTIADFVQKILPSKTLLSRGTPKSELPDFSARLSKYVSPSIQTETDIVTASPSLPSTSHEIIYETPKISLDAGEIQEEEKDVGNEGDVTEKEVQQFGTKHFGELPSPYVTPNLYNRSYFDTDFGISKDADGQFRIGNSLNEIDEHSNVIVQGKTYTGTQGLFEFLTRKKVNHSLISTQDLKNYKRTLQVTSGHMKNNDPLGVIKTTRGVKFREVITQLFDATRKRVVETALRHKCLRYNVAYGDFNYAKRQFNFD